MIELLNHKTFTSIKALALTNVDAYSLAIKLGSMVDAGELEERYDVLHNGVVIANFDKLESIPNEIVFENKKINISKTDISPTYRLRN